MKKDIVEFNKPNSFDREIMEKLPCPCIYDFDNRLTALWFQKIGNGKDKGKYKIWTLLALGKSLEAKDWGFPKGNDTFEQNMTMVASKEQMIELRDALNKRFPNKRDNTKNTELEELLKHIESELKRNPDILTHLRIDIRRKMDALDMEDGIK